MQNEVMYSRLIDIPINHNKSFFLFGPRGAGKSTWIKSSFSDALYFDPLEFYLYNDLLV
jgi:ABC-type ATPase involved in cell division